VTGLDGSEDLWVTHPDWCALYKQQVEEMRDTVEDMCLSDLVDEVLEYRILLRRLRSAGTTPTETPLGVYRKGNNYNGTTPDRVAHCAVA